MLAVVSITTTLYIIGSSQGNSLILVAIVFKTYYKRLL